MADVKNLHALSIDAIENLIAVSADDLDADRWVGRDTRLNGLSAMSSMAA